MSETKTLVQSVIKSDFKKIDQNVIEKIINAINERIVENKITGEAALQTLCEKLKDVIDRTYQGDFTIFTVGAHTSYAIKFRKDCLYVARLTNNAILLISRSPFYELLHPDQVMATNYVENLTVESRAIRNCGSEFTVKTRYPASTLDGALEASFVEPSISDKAVEVIIQTYRAAVKAASTYKEEVDGATKHPLDSMNLASSLRNHLTKASESLWHVIVGPSLHIATPKSAECIVEMEIRSWKPPKGKASSSAPLRVVVYKDAQESKTDILSQLRNSLPYVAMLCLCVLLLMRGAVCGTSYESESKALRTSYETHLEGGDIGSAEFYAAQDQYRHFLEKSFRGKACPTIKSDYLLGGAFLFFVAAAFWRLVGTRLFSKRVQGLDDEEKEDVDSKNKAAVAPVSEKRSTLRQRK